MKASISFFILKSPVSNWETLRIKADHYDLAAAMIDEFAYSSFAEHNLTRLLHYTEEYLETKSFRLFGSEDSYQIEPVADNADYFRVFNVYLIDDIEKKKVDMNSVDPKCIETIIPAVTFKKYLSLYLDELKKFKTNPYAYKKELDALEGEKVIELDTE